MSKFTVLIITFLFPVHIFSQTTDLTVGKINVPVNELDFSKLNFENLNFGVSVNPSISWINVDHNDVYADGATMKFGVSGIAEYEFIPNISIVTGVNYNSIGGYVSDNKSLNNNLIKDNYQITYSQVVVPIGLKLRSNQIKNYCYYAQGGASSGFILTAEEKYRSVTPHTQISPVDILSLTNSTNIGYFAGVGIESRLIKKIRIFGEITYVGSMTSTSLGSKYQSDGVHNYGSYLSLFPGNVLFSVGVMFK